jgi:very-short-patch-repair endonuclease
MGLKKLRIYGAIMQSLSIQKYAMIVARELRKKQTTAERLLWKRLRNKKLSGYKFNRQFPIFYKWNNIERFFIADFYCHELSLIIEVDGGVHEQQKEYDKIRQHILELMNCKIIRFTNKEITDEIDAVLKKIKKVTEI